MGKRDRLRKERVIAGLESPFRQEPVFLQRYLTCSKCRTAMPEGRVTEHLLECQPGGVVCGICGYKVSAAGFLAHFKECLAKRA